MSEAVRIDNRVKAEAGMSQVVSVIMKNLGVGTEGLDGLFRSTEPIRQRGCRRSGLVGESRERFQFQPCSARA
jgi:hypothetical protein